MALVLKSFIRLRLYLFCLLRGRNKNIFKLKDSAEVKKNIACGF